MTHAVRCLLVVAALAADGPVRAELPQHTEDRILHTNIERTDANLFMPGGVKRFRGVVVFPADKNVGPGSVWGECCRHWQMGHLGLMLENVDKRNNRPRTLKKVLDGSLKEFAEKTGHSELNDAPWVFSGMSKGGGWAAELGQSYPARTIAFNNVCGWVGKPEQDLSMPAVIVIGGVPDGFKMLDAIGTQYEPARQKGACWCLALQWGNAHNYGNTNSLAIPFLDAVIAARLPKPADTPSGQVTLKVMKLEDGWLGDRGTWEGHRARIARYAEYPGDKAAATWLPNRYVAYAWRSFVSKDPPVQLDAATSDGRLKTAAFKPTDKRFLILCPGTLIELTADIRKGTSIHRAAFYDGDRLLGEAPSAPFRRTWSGITPGPHSVFIEYTTSTGELDCSNPVLLIASER